MILSFIFGIITLSLTYVYFCKLKKYLPKNHKLNKLNDCKNNLSVNKTNLLRDVDRNRYSRKKSQKI